MEAWRFGIGDISGILHIPCIDLPKIFINADDFMTFSRRWVQLLLCCVLLLSCRLGEKTACVSDEYTLCRAGTSIACATVDNVWYVTDTVFS